MTRTALPRVLLITLLGLPGAFSVDAQDFAYPWQPRSGDAQVDAQLADINRYAARWPNTFTDELLRYHHAPRDLVETLLQRRWAPGDIYFACALAEAAGRPCRALADEWERHHADGWGAIAQRFGVAPGSPAFRQIERALAASYARWGRPLPSGAPPRSAVPDVKGHAVPPGFPAPPPEDEGPRGDEKPAKPSGPNARRDGLPNAR